MSQLNSINSINQKINFLKYNLPDLAIPIILTGVTKAQLSSFFLSTNIVCELAREQNKEFLCELVESNFPWELHQEIGGISYFIGVAYALGFRWICARKEASKIAQRRRKGNQGLVGVSTQYKQRKLDWFLLKQSCIARNLLLNILSIKFSIKQKVFLVGFTRKIVLLNCVFISVRILLQNKQRNSVSI